MQAMANDSTYTLADIVCQCNAPVEPEILRQVDERLYNIIALRSGSAPVIPPTEQYPQVYQAIVLCE